MQCAAPICWSKYNTDTEKRRKEKSETLRENTKNKKIKRIQKKERKTTKERKKKTRYRMKERKRQMYVVYFDHILGSACVVYFVLLLGARSTRKLVEIHNRYRMKDRYKMK